MTQARRSYYDKTFSGGTVPCLSHPNEHLPTEPIFLLTKLKTRRQYCTLTYFSLTLALSVDCDDIARELVKKYACLRDVHGSGYISLPAHMSGCNYSNALLFMQGSWSQAIRVRVWNVFRKKVGGNQESVPRPKKSKAVSRVEKHAFPPVSLAGVYVGDEVSFERNKKDLDAELKKVRAFWCQLRIFCA